MATVGGKTILRDPQGRYFQVAPTEVESAKRELGLSDVSQEEANERANQRKLEQEQGSVGNQLRAGAEKVVRTATFGAIPRLGGTEEEAKAREDIFEYRSPWANIGAQAAGAAVPGLGAAGLAARGLKLAGAGARAMSLGTVLAEGTAVGTAEEVEQARVEDRPISIGNIALFGIGGELAGRALPWALKRGASKALDAVDGVARSLKGVDNIIPQLESKALTRGARRAADMAPGPERTKVLAHTAKEQYAKAAQDATDGWTSGTKAAEKTAIPPDRLQDLLPDNAAKANQFTTEAGRILRRYARVSGGSKREMLTMHAERLLDTEDALGTYRALEAAEESIRSSMPDLSKYLREGLEDPSIFGDAGRFQADVGRTRMPKADFIKTDGSIDQSKLSSALRKPKQERGAVDQTIRDAAVALEDRAAIHQKWGTASMEEVQQLRQSAKKLRSSVDLADDTYAARTTKSTSPAPNKEPTIVDTLIEEGIEYGIERAIGAAIPGGGLVVKGLKYALRGVDDSARASIRDAARNFVRNPPFSSDAWSRTIRAGNTSAMASFIGEYAGPNESYEAKKDMLQGLMHKPHAINDALSYSVGDLPREDARLYMQMAQRVNEMYAYAAKHLPPSIATSLQYPRGIPPSQSAIREFGLMWSAVMDPVTVLDAIEDGSAVPQQIKHLKSVHPDIYQTMAQEVVAEVANNFEDMPHQTKVWLDTLLGGDGLAGPGFSGLAGRYINEGLQRSQGVPAPPMNPDVEGEGMQASSLENLKNSVTNRGA